MKPVTGSTKCDHAVVGEKLWWRFDFTVIEERTHFAKNSHSFQTCSLMTLFSYHTLDPEHCYFSPESMEANWAEDLSTLVVPHVTPEKKCSVICQTNFIFSKFLTGSVQLLLPFKCLCMCLVSFSNHLEIDSYRCLLFAGWKSIWCAGTESEGREKSFWGRAGDFW